MLKARVEREKSGEGESEDGQQKGERGLTKCELLAPGIAHRGRDHLGLVALTRSYGAFPSSIGAIGCFALRHPWLGVQGPASETEIRRIVEGQLAQLSSSA